MVELMKGDINQDSTLSSYQPSAEVVRFTKIVKDDYTQGEEILTRSWLEFNNRSVIEDENRGQMMFNAFVDETVEDPSEAWKWRGTRSKARNKGIVMHANLTAAFMIPFFTAQNEDDEVDQQFSEVMQDICEWMTHPSNSNYQSSFLNVVFGMLQNPVTFMGAEYCEIFQKIKERKADGTLDIKEVLDEVLSGFQCPVWSSSQILINNAYERNIQKQRCIIKRRYVERGELAAKYGDHPNWGYVQDGTRSVYNESDGLFYDIKDLEHPTLVAEETYINRRDDTEVCFAGGIYLGAPSIDENPIHHRDHLDRPKYDVVPFGYTRIGQHFFYYKSMMNALGWDNMLYDAMSEVVMNRAFLEVEMPIVVSGTDEIDSDIVFPGNVLTLEDKEATARGLLPASNLAAGISALKETENSIDEGSVNATTSAQLPDAQQKAYSVAKAQESAKIILKGVGRSLAESMVQIGDLMKDIALNNLTVPQVEELTGGALKLKYRSFFTSSAGNDGSETNKGVYLDSALIGKSMSKQDKESAEVKMLEEAGYPDKKVSIRRVNPEMIAKFRYLSKIDLEEMFVKTPEYWQAVMGNLFSLLANDPYIEPEELRRKLLSPYFRSGSDKLIKKQPLGLPAAQPGANPLGDMVNKKNLSTVAAKSAGVY